jgi:hypothetical protein
MRALLEKRHRAAVRQRRPRLRAHNAVDGKAFAFLERFHGLFGLWAEYAIYN